MFIIEDFVVTEM